MRLAFKFLLFIFLFLFFFFSVFIFGGAQFKIIPWVDCTYVTPQFGCFYSQ